MRKLLFLMLSVGALIVFCSTAGATPFAFGDNNNYLTNWTNGIDDGDDVVGTPQIIGGGGSILDADGKLDTVYFDYTSYNSLYGAGDLFIDLGVDNNWDYVADVSAGKVWQITSSFSSLQGVNDDYYELADDYFGAYDVDRYREGHAVAMDTTASGLTFNDFGTFSLIDFNSDLTTSVTFSGLGIDLLDQPFFIAFAPTCANDVIYERVPEPSTALFLGSLFLGFGVFGHRRFLKR